ncbi:MAG: type IV secretory system conjugative DNA transfer family protein [Cohaesibacter sp.]|nr:type IV secretory system conjugative DNA transfer family protein [Cohaesibacter sp.]
MNSAREKNSSTIEKAVATAALFVLYQFVSSAEINYYLTLLFKYLFYFGALSTLWSLYGDFRWWRFTKSLEKPLGLEGTTRTPHVRDLIEAGLKTQNLDGQGFPLGEVDRTYLFFDGPGHIYVTAATNGGKTESSAAPALFALGVDRNIVVTAKGADLVHLCAHHRKAIGQDVIIIDPFGMCKDIDLPTHDFNEIGHLPDPAAKDSPELFEKSLVAAKRRIPDKPKSNASSDDIFGKVAQTLLNGSIAYFAHVEAETGELACNLPYIQRVFSSSDAEFQEFLRDMALCEKSGGAISAVAKNFQAKLERTPKFAESVLTEVQSALALYTKGTILGSRTEYSDFDPSVIKTGKVTIFIVIPPEKSETHGSYAGAIVDVLVDAAIEANMFEPRVTFLLDEFAKLSKSGPLPSILTCLFIGRSRGAQIAAYLQTGASLKALYGEEASAFTSQAEITIAFSIRDFNDAELYSKRSGKRAVMAQNYNLPEKATMQGEHQYSVGINERAVPIMRPEEFMQLPDFTAALFYKQNPVHVAKLISYRQVDPWVHQAGIDPGAPKLKPLPIKFRF